MNFEDYIARLSIAITPLRKEVLSIFWQNSHPLKAYTVLDKLQQIRPSAKPPTVYRVLDYLTQMDIVHRVEGTQSYMLCLNQTEHEHSKQILLVCQNCQDIQEISDSNIQKSINNLTRTSHFSVSHSVIEIYGTCQICLQSNML